MLTVFIIAPVSGEPSDSAEHGTVTSATQQTVVERRLIQPDDRVLFVGDEITQQMFYGRAVASAVLAVTPEADMRFFNGGRDGATAASAAEWIGPLMELCNPTVVFMCFGLNDGKLRDTGEPVSKTFHKNLTALGETNPGIFFGPTSDHLGNHPGPARPGGKDQTDQLQLDFAGPVRRSQDGCP